MNKTLSAIIVDDEDLARKGLAFRLAAFDDVNVIAQCGSASDAISTIAQLQPDVVFLDIQMPEQNGFDVVQSLLKQGINLPMIVFVTAFENYAVRAFEVHAQDYLLKPVSEERLAECIAKIRQSKIALESDKHKTQLAQLVSDITGTGYQDVLSHLATDTPIAINQFSDVLAIKDGSEVTRVPIQDIIWVEAAGDYMCVYTSEQTHILRKTMKELEESLDPSIFIRSHRSTIVNKHYIDKLCNQSNGELYLVLKNDKQIKVSRGYKDKVKKAISS